MKTDNYIGGRFFGKLINVSIKQFKIAYQSAKQVYIEVFEGVVLSYT